MSNVVGVLIEGAITLRATERREEKGAKREVKDRQAWKREDDVQFEIDR